MNSSTSFESAEEDVKDSPTISTTINIMQRMLAIINFLLKVSSGRREEGK